jgi:hypothetical protein
MGRRTRLARSLFLSIAISAAACVGPAATPIVIYVTAPPYPTFVPTATPVPTSTSNPTAVPVQLEAGTLKYSANACFVTDILDSDGHRISGAFVTITIILENKGWMKSRPVWLVVAQDGFSRQGPRPYGSNSLGPEWYASDGSISALPGRALAPGEQVTWNQKWFFGESDRIDYSVSVRVGPTIDRDTATVSDVLLSELVHEYEPVYTTVTVC